MSRIYLEAKPVIIAGVNTGYYHLYLVQRVDPLPATSAISHGEKQATSAEAGSAGPCRVAPRRWAPPSQARAEERVARAQND
jgi:hypothetical protein